MPKRPSGQGANAEDSTHAPHLDTTNVTDGPLSPPISQESSDITHQDPGFDFDVIFSLEQDTLSLPLEPSGSSSFLPGLEEGAHDIWNPPLELPSRGLQEPLNGPFEEAFQPDTASSFNMPYTTATNYNWLFDLGTSLDTDAGNPPAYQHQHTQIPPGSIDNMERRPSDTQIDMPEVRASPSDDIHSSRSSAKRTRIAYRPSSSHPSIAQSDSHYTISEPDAQTEATFISPLGLFEMERPLATLQRPNSLPCIDECTRAEILELIETLRPVSPENDSVTRENKLLSLSSLQTYLDLFFTRFNSAYPLIHQPTFIASDVECLLLLSMLLLGATYSGKASHQLAVCIHDVMRPGIFSHPGFSARPELWMLETILLVECFGKYAMCLLRLNDLTCLVRKVQSWTAPTQYEPSISWTTDKPHSTLGLSNYSAPRPRSG